MTDIVVPRRAAPCSPTRERVLLAPGGLDVAKLSRVLADIHAHDVDFADLYFQHSRFESWSLEEGIVKAGSFNIDRGVGVRAVRGEKQAFAYSDDISLAALDEAAAAVRAIGRAGAIGGRRRSAQPATRAPLYPTHDPSRASPTRTRSRCSSASSAWRARATRASCR